MFLTKVFSIKTDNFNYCNRKHWLSSALEKFSETKNRVYVNLLKRTVYKVNK